MLSPDGRWLAYVRKRPRNTATFHQYDGLSGGDRCDVWIVDTAGGAPQNLTRGAEDGSGHWREATAEAQEATVMGFAGSMPLLWVAASFGPAAREWAVRRGPMTLLVEAEGALPEGERRRIDRFVALLGRQAE